MLLLDAACWVPASHITSPNTGKSVIVLKRGEIMNGTSNATAGRITMQDNTPRFFGEIAWRSYNNYKTLSEELGADLEYKITGGMKLIYDKEGLKKKPSTP